ncbi:MAG TPA: MBL fold metallo-hydrolase [Candidatus Limnocylindrales bacterium]|nr:MBL fold metallo-hydrolase [Candidatus Limnocylindrales bacterium]
MGKIITVEQNKKFALLRLQTEPFGTNVYLVICRETGESVVIDAPGDTAAILEQLRNTKPRFILLTHGHMDHTVVLEELRTALKVPLAAHEADSAMMPLVPDMLLQGGELVQCGNSRLEVMHTPGHTPGSLCFRVGSLLLSGDTIFPGGPGKTWSPAGFKNIISSITEKIFALPDDTLILPGHGESTNVKTEKELFNTFAARKHADDLYGEVAWLGT